MAFVDEITLHIRAGRGGRGVVRWRHEKGKEYSGPAGGNGGRGGDVYIRAVRDIGILARYRHSKIFEAQSGQDGMRDSMHGRNGEDLIIDLPRGSVVTDMRINRSFSLITEGEQIRILKGGVGGLGNEHFKASTNTRPNQSTDGYEGEEGDFKIELELIADIGLIGFPNAGKTSLLNALTNAGARVGSYAFTTLEPNLGVMIGGYVIADIPGLIEGASEGKGLGHAFLRHARRTTLILHCISAEEINVTKAYKTIRTELEQYDQELAGKREIVLITKTDTTDDATVQKHVRELKDLKIDNVITGNIIDDTSLKNIADTLVKMLRVQ